MVDARGSNVDTAGALVSPLISAPNPLDFLLGRGNLSVDRGLIVEAAEWLDGKLGKGSRVVDISESKALPSAQCLSPLVFTASGSNTVHTHSKVII